MAEAGIPAGFIAEAVKFGEVDQGFFNLIQLWSEAEDDPEEREELLFAMQEELDEEQDLATGAPPVFNTKLDCDKLDNVIPNVIAFKAKLKDIIDRDHGGVTQAAAKIGMPQPSLSRFLNSSTIPRRTTLYKIARGLGLPESMVSNIVF